MSDEKKADKTIREMADDVIEMLGDSLNDEIETQLRALHARGSVYPISLAVAYLAIGYATTRSLEFSPQAAVVLQAAASIVSRGIKTLPAERVAELTEEQRAMARRLGARIPKIGKA